MNRRITKTVNVGGVLIGGTNAISVQSMTNTKTSDINATVEQIKSLEAAGCDIARVAIPDLESAKAISQIKSKINIPLVADIHFDYKLALMCMENGIDKVRINPGNIGSEEGVFKTAEMAKKMQIPIRIGVNGGSLEKSILEKYNGATAEALVESALSHAALLEKFGFYDIVLSLKASDVPTMIEAYKLASEKTDYPLHLGVTEAGTYETGIIKSSIGLGALLSQGIGDTIRVSLTDNPVNEVYCAIDILKALNLKKGGIKFVSCPTCGRCRINLIEIANSVYSAIKNIDKDIKVAVMGCAVNGPGEAKDADIGIAGGNGEAPLFKKGEIIKKISEDKIIETLVEEIEKM